MRFAAVAAAVHFAAAWALAEGPGEVEFFESKVRPILTEHCLKCHDGKVHKGALRLDSKAGWEKGGDTGPAILPRKSSASLLIKMVRGDSGSPPAMPPDRRLPAELVADLVKWVDMGAPDPRTAAGTAPAAKGIDWAAARQFWSFRPVTVVEPAATGGDNPIDRAVAAGLANAGIRPVGPADRWTLLRRATFGLTGLPPTAEEAAAFAADAAPDAFAKVVDRLLASPAYGEHQARLWLDLARYAEDQAHPSEGKNTHAWRYRDWVIEAFNKDVPYDRFVKLQIAADLMERPDDDPADRRALGFIGLGAIYPRPNDLARARADQWDDRLDTLTRTFLGLTVSCARCHDHKFDPIPTQDYYSLLGVIANSKDAVISVAPRPQQLAYDAAAAKSAEAADKAKAWLQAEIDRLAGLRAASLPDYVTAVWRYNLRKANDAAVKSPDEEAKAGGIDVAAFKKLDAYLRSGAGRPKALQKWETLLPAKGAAAEPPAAVREAGEALAAAVKEQFGKPPKQRNLDLLGSLFGEKGAFPLTEKTVLPAAAAEWTAEYAKRTEAAKAAAAAMPPEPAKANGVVEVEKPTDLRVYLRGNPYKFGEPAPRRFLRILAGPEPAKFAKGSGRLELAEAIANAGSPLTARVMVNRIWQQHFGRGLVATPSNFGALGGRPTHPELLDYLADSFVRGGWSVKRLHREILLSQTYQRSSAGDAAAEAVDPENQLLWRVSRRRLTVEELRDAALAASGALDRTAGGPSTDVDDVKNLRRTVYGKVSRMDLAKLLRLFDFPDPNITADRRTDTTIPQQSLFLLNSPFVIERAKALAARFAGEDAPAAVRRAFALALARKPTEAEFAIAVRFLSAPDAGAEAGRNKLTRAERFAQALLAGNAFLFVD